MVAAAAEDDNAEGRGGVESSVGLKVVCRCCCFISTTTFTLKSGESICCAALRRLSKGSIFYRCRCLQDMSALGKCSFFMCTHKESQRYTTTLCTSRGAILHRILCACLFVRLFRDFRRILLLPRGHERGTAMPICGGPFFLPSDSWRGSCAGVSESMLLQAVRIVRRPSLAWLRSPSSEVRQTFQMCDKITCRSVLI